MPNSLSILHKLEHPLFDKYQVSVQIKRDDQLHDIISGNKWRKLKYNLTQITEGNYVGALTFGGSYSNHIHAFAYACKLQNIPCIGIIRGEENYANNFTLSWARHWGMRCHFVDRKTYRRRFDTDYLSELKQLYPDYFIIPEGGSNSLAISGVAEVITELNQQTEFDTLLTPVGSGGTLTGLIAGDCNEQYPQHKIVGVAVLKQAEYLLDDIESLLHSRIKSQKTPLLTMHSNWHLLTEFHRGGYGKFSNADVERLLEFNQQTGVIFEPVYSGKMILAMLDLLTHGYFKPGERIVLLHTGGLQGLGGMIEQGRLNSDEWPAPKTVLDGTF
ncbi:1-aminocyclopropane-1-carboxylate deaminase/D-cysteine desulfhydrase [Colwellia echini]|uniref:1-aminocyclopropane-1-carboxylate deaminase/D-cysteine desulfhydrase n=1 Tax=Colwellia echini TaxID=1982103 RepID=A0ABY3N112_9GAMM|nr:pyridoxal-phosphate dependent enzyme [Colwellia echini]TYK67135.1 1-aminocyclopropane-1-carboxylate deaminase/D-cysteine desulfhydrase [Colwellia echini]